MGEENVLSHGDNPNTWGILIVCVVLYFVVKAIKPEWFNNN